MYNEMVEELLTTYRYNKERIAIKTNMYNCLQNELYGSPIAYDKDKLSATNRIVSSVEDNAILLAEISKIIKYYQDRIKMVERLLGCLSETELLIIRYRYMQADAYTWKQISRIADRTERQCRRIKIRAMNKLVNNLKK